VWYYCPRRYSKLSPKWQNLFTGPFTVIRLLDPCNVVIRRYPRGREIVVHRDKVKPVLEMVDVTGAGGKSAPVAKGGGGGKEETNGRDKRKRRSRSAGLSNDLPVVVIPNNEPVHPGEAIAPGDLGDDECVARRSSRKTRHPGRFKNYVCRVKATGMSLQVVRQWASFSAFVRRFAAHRHRKTLRFSHGAGKIASIYGMCTHKLMN